MQYQQTPQGLASMFDSNVANGGGSIAAAPSLMGLLTQQQNADQMTQQDQSRQLQYDTANDPLKLAKSSLDNQTLQAELPGHVADSSIRGVAADKAKSLSAADIKDALGQFDTKAIQRHVTDASSAGDLLAQAAQGAIANPLGAKDRVKASLMSNGLGHMWNEDWDDPRVTPGQFALELHQYGTGLQDVSAKFHQQMQLADQKGELAIERQREISRSNQLRDMMKLEGVRATLATKERLGNIPKNWDDYGAKMLQHAKDATTEDERAALTAEAEKAFQVSKQLKSAAAGTAAGVKPALNAVGIPENQDVNPGPPSPLAAPGKVSPSDAAHLAKLPAGSKANGDGTFMLPDGTRIRPKQ